MTRTIFSKLALPGALLLAACGPTTPPPAPPPPPPPAPVVVAPPRQPTPPMGAMQYMTIPPLRADGLRDTPNRDIGPAETLWHFRSAFNVAALNCQNAEHYRIADDYNLFLKTHKRTLDGANRAIESKFRQQYGSGYARIRDTHTTQVYNFFSLPPVKSEFCNAAMILGQEANLTASADLETFAARALPQLEGVFDRFFLSYEQYNRDLAEWLALYGPPPAPVMSSEPLPDDSVAGPGS
ncbi:MAG: hypothetical protein R3E02_11940 [Blastomonas sp.]